MEHHAVTGGTRKSSSIHYFGVLFQIYFEINVVIVGIRVANGAQCIPSESLCLSPLWCGWDQKRSSDHKDA